MSSKKYQLYNQLHDLYDLLNIDSGLIYKTEKDGNDWVTEIEGDGKLLHDTMIGYGETPIESFNDAVDRFISVTPTLDDVPLKKLLELMEYRFVHQGKENKAFVLSSDSA